MTNPTGDALAASEMMTVETHGSRAEAALSALRKLIVCDDHPWNAEYYYMFPDRAKEILKWHADQQNATLTAERDAALAEAARSRVALLDHINDLIVLAQTLADMGEIDLRGLRATMETPEGQVYKVTTGQQIIDAALEAYSVATKDALADAGKAGG